MSTATATATARASARTAAASRAKATPRATAKAREGCSNRSSRSGQAEGQSAACSSTLASATGKAMNGYSNSTAVRSKLGTGSASSQQHRIRQHRAAQQPHSPAEGQQQHVSRVSLGSRAECSRVSGSDREWQKVWQALQGAQGMAEDMGQSTASMPGYDCTAQESTAKCQQAAEVAASRWGAGQHDGKGQGSMVAQQGDQGKSRAGEGRSAAAQAAAGQWHSSTA